MTRYRLTSLILAASSLLFSGCAMLGLGGEPDPRWADYTSWQKLNTSPITGDHTGFLGGLHEGAEGVREIYVNSQGFATADGQGPYQYPVGTVIVKEQYKDLAALKAGKKPGLTIMVKARDDAQTPADNWDWSRGYTQGAGADSFCSSCHTVAMTSDFVFSNATTLESFR